MAIKQSFNLTVSCFQKSIVFGTLLGDSYITNITKRGNIQIEQALEKKEYVMWLFNQLQSLTTEKNPSVVTRIDKRSLKITQSLRFYTKALFLEWRSLFYNQKRKKQLPLNFHESLNDISLAVWFLDDGGRYSGVKAGAFLTLDSYTLDEIESIQHTLSTKFQLNGHLYKAGKSINQGIQRRLIFKGQDYKKFYDLVYPITSQIPSFSEKKLVVPISGN